MSDYKDLLDTLSTNLTDPAAIQKAVYDHRLALSNGEIDLVDISNPYSHLMESTAATAAALATEIQLLSRRNVRSLTATPEELYYHMSDKDYLDRFSVPTTSNMLVLFPKNRLISNMVEDGNNVKVTYPRYSRVTIEDIDFINLYPIDIYQLSNGSIRVTYDTTIDSSLGKAKTNIIEHREIMLGDTQYIAIEIELLQLSRAPKIEVVNPSVPFIKKFKFNDHFYYCDVYGIATDGLTKIPYKTTHSPTLYSDNEVTVLLSVINDEITIQVPGIYIANGSIASRIGIDIYTTKGRLTVDLGDYDATAYTYRLSDVVDYSEQKQYISAILKNPDIAYSSQTVIDGGADSLSFDELKLRNIEYSEEVDTPVTVGQLKESLSTSGFQLVKAIDDPLKRIYMASKMLPNTQTSGFSIPISGFIGEFITTYSTLSTLPTVNDHGDRLTLLPNTLFKLTDGVIDIVPPGQYPEDITANNEELVSLLNQSTYLFNPYVYILDATDNGFKLSAYDLDSSLRTYDRTLVEQNTSVDVVVGTSGYLIERTAVGYTLTIQSRSDDNYKALDTSILHAQLYFELADESELGYINGTLVGTIDGEYVWEFNIETTYDIDNDVNLHIGNTGIASNPSRDGRIELSNIRFGIIYSISGQVLPQEYYTDIDSIVGVHLLPPNTLGITHEMVTVDLGSKLHNLWTNARTSVTELQFETYPEDVPYTYETQVLETNAGGDPIINIVGGIGETVVLHDVGDPVIVDGDIQYKHRAGDVVFANGEPVVLVNRDTQRHCELLLLDGKYLYSTDQRDIDYVGAVKEGILDILSDLDQYTSSLHENTSIFYYPTKNIGVSEVVTGNNIKSLIPNDLEFNVVLYVNEVNYALPDVRESLELVVSEVINEYITKDVIGIDDIISEIRRRAGDDIIAVDVGKFGPNEDIAVFRNISQIIKRTVRRNLQVNPDQTLTMVESINIIFKVN